MNIAECTIYIFTSCVAWACQISRKRDSQGNEIIPPHYNYTSAFNTQAKPFLFDLQARSREKAEYVAQAWEEEKMTDPLKHTANYELGQASGKQSLGQ
jgi:hypothetical protein